MKRGCFRFVITLAVLFMYCTQPPGLNTIIVDDYADNLLNKKKLVSMRGSGNVEVSIEGKRYSGSADIIVEADSIFKMDVYSPFGSTIFSIRCNNETGIATLQDTMFRFRPDESMARLPFLWGELITFDEFFDLLSSQFTIFMHLLLSQPDSVLNDKSFQYRWSSDHAELLLEINQKYKRIKKIIYTLSGKNDVIIQFDNFSNTMARRISFFDNDKNYFVIDYEKINTIFN